MLLVDQIGESHMHGFSGLYICYWEIRLEDHICMVLQVCTYVNGRSDSRITYAWFYMFVRMLLGDQIGGSHMHGYMGFGHICCL